jgi:hypothetical protein
MPGSQSVTDYIKKIVMVATITRLGRA